MKPNEWLFDAIGSVEDSLLAQTEKYTAKKHYVFYIGAACLCLLLLVGLALRPSLSENAAAVPVSAMESLAQKSSAAARILVTGAEHTLVYSPIDEETTCFTDYSVTVLEGYFGTVSAGESIVIRTEARGTSQNENAQATAFPDIAKGSVLLVFLYQPPVEVRDFSSESNAFYLADSQQGVFMLRGETAICMNDGRAYQVNDLIEQLIPTGEK